jgi:hypothetical protein
MPRSGKAVCIAADGDLFFQGDRASGVVLLPAGIDIDDAVLDKMEVGLAARVKQFLSRPSEAKQVEPEGIEDRPGPRPMGRPRSR